MTAIDFSRFDALTFDTYGTLIDWERGILNAFQVVFGIANSLIKPVIKLLTFPINFMTMGLFTFVINTVLVLGVAWVANTYLKIAFTIAGFPKDGISFDAVVMAFLASIIISVVTTVIGIAVKD